ncbi:hypothetical protein PHMEG_0005603 [Phytophthora megakarya]|uniref:Uncharacterized protein n=1 Tax=Phytophthora megakarya TaxID=4795 RepID=A0A225WR28_9STRA|nr:hypothetical protein PHMEG_0005601 [Phytophthora megakarya]OWZ20057.1 hypothetical protein PHMEG_0005603 [Phytophthora megakarya]
MWRPCSGHPYVNKAKIDLCVALGERRHRLQVSSMENAIHAFRETSDLLDPFTRIVLDLWSDLNRTRNNRADFLDNKSIGCSGTSTLPTQVLLEPSYLQYSIEVLWWAPATEDWSRELRVLDAEQPWRNCWIGAPVDHPYSMAYIPCNPDAPCFVPSSMP